ncbi:hypothetical protein ACFT9M_12275 [Micromonospora purpureochromogenes]|uniref:hypothetical protein n=1 Tax=Micromonospora purpureochromogenes TaxID=47872 RepID=UPI0036267F32
MAVDRASAAMSVEVVAISPVDVALLGPALWLRAAGKAGAGLGRRWPPGSAGTVVVPGGTSPASRG